MYEVIATESHIWIVTELCCGGELFDYLVEKGRLSEDETRLIFGQLCLAVAYLHDNNIVHRDLKLENVLLDERCRVKLGDFGFTREFDRGAFMETFCGTTGYAAPEMLLGKKYQGPGTLLKFFETFCLKFLVSRGRCLVAWDYTVYVVNRNTSI
jgi:serine/threonine protein kinase